MTACFPFSRTERVLGAGVAASCARHSFSLTTTSSAASNNRPTIGVSPSVVKNVGSTLFVPTTAVSLLTSRTAFWLLVYALK